MHVLMVAAENGALKGGKVGGIADVIRDVPQALARAGHRVTVITPGYGRLSRLPGVELQYSLTVEFNGGLEQVFLHRLADPSGLAVEHWLVEHPLFAACGEGSIYCNDRWEPFATDAHKFALFCAAVCQALASSALPRPDVMHLHDWHATLVLFLRRYRYMQLQDIRCVFTIHNLSIQGVRPFANNRSSLNAWYSFGAYQADEIRDPHSPNCVNLMRLGINLADQVHVVSPSYAREILQPSNPVKGFIGGEGLERDLARVEQQGRLVGILNGCEYPDAAPPPAPSRAEFLALAEDCLLEWAGETSQLSTAFYFAQQRLRQWQQRGTPDKLVLGSVCRLTAQKVALLEVELAAGTSTLEALLEELGDGSFVLLGSGDPHYEAFMTRAMIRHENFLFLRGFSERLSDALYRYCELFLMPSSFEPCGIGQMLALRAGKPCLVHKVGGLADTVQEGRNGFVFEGDSPQEQCQALLQAFGRARQLHADRPEQWRSLSRQAAAERFSWQTSVRDYLDKLYLLPAAPAEDAPLAPSAAAPEGRTRAPGKARAKARKS